MISASQNTLETQPPPPGQWHRFFYDDFFQLFFGFIGMLLLFTAGSLLVKYSSVDLCCCCRLCCGCWCRRCRRRRAAVAAYATVSGRDSVSIDDGAASIYADVTLTETDRELLRTQEYLESRAVDAPYADRGQNGWGLTAANRYLGLHDSFELGLGEAVSPRSARELVARRGRVARQLGVQPERLQDWSAIAAHRLDVYASEGRTRRPSLKALAICLASWVDHCVGSVDQAYHALAQTLRGELAIADGQVGRTEVAGHAGQLPASLVAEAVVALSEALTAGWFKLIRAGLVGLGAGRHRHFDRK